MIASLVARAVYRSCYLDGRRLTCSSVFAVILCLLSGRIVFTSKVKFSKRLLTHSIEGFKISCVLNASVVHDGVGQSNTAVATILDQLQQEPAYSRHLPDHSIPRKFSLVSVPDSEVQKFCKENGIEMPRTVPADGAWGDDGAPTFHQMFGHVWRSPRKGKTYVPGKCLTDKELICESLSEENYQRSRPLWQRWLYLSSYTPMRGTRSASLASTFLICCHDGNLEAVRSYTAMLQPLSSDTQSSTSPLNIHMSTFT